MSAYIVDLSTIHAIVTFAVGGRRRVGSCRSITDEHVYVSSADYTPDQIGQALLHENFLSVNYRYREDEETTVYTFKPIYDGYVEVGKKRLLKPIDIIKLCHCLEYQSCEHPSWQQSFAKDFLDRVVSAALHELPGYDTAPWGLSTAGGSR